MILTHMRSNRGKISHPHLGLDCVQMAHHGKRIQKNAKENLEKEAKMAGLSMCPFLPTQKADAHCFWFFCSPYD